MNKYPYTHSHFILSLILILSGFGIVMMYSASSIYAMNNFGNYMFFLTQQVKWLALGLTIMLMTSQLNYNFLKKIAYTLLILSWMIMIFGYFFKGNNPAARWLIINGRSWMTTSDLARLSLIIFTAFFIDKNKKQLNDWKFILTNFIPFFIITLLLILFQPDTSTAITISLIIMIMLFVSSVNKYLLLGISFFGIIGLITKILHTPHAISRIINWNDMQKIHSLNAFGTGGIFGSGLGDSIIKNGYLPQAHTDFILPIVGEELGFMGILVVFVLFWLLYSQGIKVMKEAPDLFSMLLSLGIIVSMMIYFIINAAYAIGLAPTTGLPMPFISYGGSHTIFTLMSMGILLNICRKGTTRKNGYYRGATYEI